MSHSVRTLRQTDKPVAPEVIAQIVRALKGLQYGAVEIVIHGGNVTQIERREKVRISSDAVPRPAD